MSYWFYLLVLFCLITRYLSFISAHLTLMLSWWAILLFGCCCRRRRCSFCLFVCLFVCLTGAASPDALRLLKPMLADTVDFVRQGAFIAHAMILMQFSVAQEPKVFFKKNNNRALFLKRYNNKRSMSFVNRSQRRSPTSMNRQWQSLALWYEW